MSLSKGIWAVAMSRFPDDRSWRELFCFSLRAYRRVCTDKVFSEEGITVCCLRCAFTSRLRGVAEVWRLFCGTLLLALVLLFDSDRCCLFGADDMHS